MQTHENRKRHLNETAVLIAHYLLLTNIIILVYIPIIFLIHCKIYVVFIIEDNEEYSNIKFRLQNYSNIVVSRLFDIKYDSM